MDKQVLEMCRTNIDIMQITQIMNHYKYRSQNDIKEHANYTKSNTQQTTKQNNPRSAEHTQAWKPCGSCTITKIN